jgi:hypothetical protein
MRSSGIAANANGRAWADVTWSRTAETTCFIVNLKTLLGLKKRKLLPAFFCDSNFQMPPSQDQELRTRKSTLC